MCVRQFLARIRHIFALDENRTCSIFIQLDQKSRQLLIFLRSVLQNIFAKWLPPLGLAAVKWAWNSQNKNYCVSMELITKYFDGKIGMRERQHFYGTQQNFK